MSDEQTTDRIVAEFPKGRDLVRVSLRTWEGKQYISLRAFFKPKGRDEWLPGKQGLSLAVGLLPRLEEAVRKLREAVNGGEENVPF